MQIDADMLVLRSKDKTIKFWDILSGSCVQTFSSHLWEVTSVDINQSGSFVLSSSKDNSNRIWDVRMVISVAFSSIVIIR